MSGAITFSTTRAYPLYLRACTSSLPTRSYRKARTTRRQEDEIIGFAIQEEPILSQLRAQRLQVPQA